VGDGVIFLILFRGKLSQPMLSLPILMLGLVKVLSDQKWPVPDWECKLFRDVSTIIFLIHTFFITVWNTILEATEENSNGELFGSTLWFFILVLLSSFLGALVIIYMAKKIKILRKLYE